MTDCFTSLHLLSRSATVRLKLKRVGERTDGIMKLWAHGGPKRGGSMAMHREARLGYVPHFDVTTLDGQRVRYDDIWQRRNLVLAVVGPQERETASRYASQLQARRNLFEQANTSIVVTGDAVPGLPAPSVLVADRWGEILYRATPSGGHDPELPDVDELLSWVHFVEIQCPECPP